MESNNKEVVMKTMKCVLDLGLLVLKGEIIVVTEQNYGKHKCYESKDSRGFPITLSQHEFENYFVEIK